MTHGLSRGFFISLFLALNLFLSNVGRAAQLECPVCGMTFKSEAKTAFSATVEGKPRHLCSFACAAKTAEKFPQAGFQPNDFNSGKTLNGGDAYYLIRSTKILRELPFDMPPSVVAFAAEKEAKEKSAKLGDGEVIHGWKNLKKTLAP